MSPTAGLSEEDAERLAPPAAPADQQTGKADAAWDEASDFPDLAESQAVAQPKSKRTPPVSQPDLAGSQAVKQPASQRTPPVPQRAVEAAPLVADIDNTGIEVPVTSFSLLAPHASSLASHGSVDSEAGSFLCSMAAGQIAVTIK